MEKYDAAGMKNNKELNQLPYAIWIYIFLFSQVKTQQDLCISTLSTVCLQLKKNEIGDEKKINLRKVNKS